MVGFALALGFSADGWSAERDPAAADALFREGRRLADAGDFKAACPKFAESQRLDPAPGTLLNLADCEEKSGRLAKAAGHFKSAIELLSERDERLPIARKRHAALEARVPKLTIRVAGELPAGARVMRDGVEFGPASMGMALPVDPGEHTVALIIAGKQARTVTVTLQEGESKQVELEPDGPPAAAGERPQQPEAAQPASGGSTKRTVGYALGGLGLAGVGAAIVTGLMVQSRKKTFDEHCDSNKQCDQVGLDAADSGKTLLTANTVSWAVGLAGLGVGTFLVLTGGDSSGSGATRAGLRPTPGGGTVVWHTTW